MLRLLSVIIVLLFWTGQAAPLMAEDKVCAEFCAKVRQEVLDMGRPAEDAEFGRNVCMVGCERGVSNCREFCQLGSQVCVENEESSKDFCIYLRDNACMTGCEFGRRQLP